MTANQQPKRRYITLWVSGAGVSAVDERAARECDGNRSEMLRRLLKYAVANMPEGWAK